MKHLCIFSFLCISLFCKAQTITPPLFPIYENTKTGFIDSKGKVVIQPVLRSAGDFQEGLASARMNGTYGYIDHTGKFVIEPQYDYAADFKEGFAIVYKDGKPFYINKLGQKPFQVNFSKLEPFEKGRAKIETFTKKQGYINRQGKLVIDTVFSKINPFIEGFAVVKGMYDLFHNRKDSNYVITYDDGVIDTTGKFLIPYGTYSSIGDLSANYFSVEIPREAWDTIEGYSKKSGFVDKTGKLLFAKSHENSSWIDGDIHCGLVKMNLYKYWLPEENGISYTSTKTYQGFVNLKGELVVNDTNYKYVYDFSENRAFVQDEDRNTFLIDTHGKKVCADTFGSIATEQFHNGVAFVKKHGKYGMIDTNGIFIIKPQYNGIDEIGLLGNYFFTREESSDENSDYDELFGIVRKDGSTLLKPTLLNFDRNGFKNGLLKCVIKEKLAYVDESGQIIWEEKKDSQKNISNLNIDVMNRGYFYAHSKPHKRDLGGFGGSDNEPQPISKKNNFPENKLSVIVTPNLKDTIFHNYVGMNVFIANTSKHQFDFNAQDSRLYMKVQALDQKGQWQDIEYLPSSWCGNSYHILSLESKKFWTFLTPVYEGDFKTKLRIELKYIDPEDKSENRWDKKEITIYSNEYEGSINPGQLWRKGGYRNGGIMDPYND